MSSTALRLSEADVTRQATDFLRFRGWQCRRQQSGLFGPKGKMTRVGEVGCFDYTCLRPTGTIGFVQHFYLEMKRPGEKLRPAQESWMELQRESGFFCVAIDSLEAMQKWYEVNFG